MYKIQKVISMSSREPYLLLVPTKRSCSRGLSVPTVKDLSGVLSHDVARSKLVVV